MARTPRTTPRRGRRTGQSSGRIRRPRCRDLDPDRHFCALCYLRVRHVECLPRLVQAASPASRTSPRAARSGGRAMHAKQAILHPKPAGDSCVIPRRGKSLGFCRPNSSPKMRDPPSRHSVLMKSKTQSSCYRACRPPTIRGKGCRVLQKSGHARTRCEQA